ncbi:MAG TPA: VOC family protein [Candidatus Baltobacteraceae bacterium]
MTDVSLILYPVADMNAAKQFFGELIGAEPYVDGAPQYVGYKSGATEIGLVPNGDQRESSALPYWDVSDIAGKVKELVAAGGAIVQEITDVGYGMLVASVKDPNGATVGLRQPPQG